MIPAASQATALPENVASSALTKKSGVMTDYEKKNLKSFRLRVVPHFFSRIVERAKRELARKSPHARKGDTRVG